MREIVSDIPELDAFVCAVGTGGTISGVSRFLKEHKSPAKIIGVEPRLPRTFGRKTGSPRSKVSVQFSYQRSAM